METIIYRKNQYVTSRGQAEALLEAMDDFVKSPVSTGKGQPSLDSLLMKIWNSGERLDWKWSEETEADYIHGIAREKAAEKELALFRSDNKVWKDAVIRPWRDRKLREWIDDTYIRPLFYDLTREQEAEKVRKRRELLDWPALSDFDEYRTLEEVDALEPETPDWITNNKADMG